MLVFRAGEHQSICPGLDFLSLGRRFYYGRALTEIAESL
jgi:hypothetical protein